MEMQAVATLMSPAEKLPLELLVYLFSFLNIRDVIKNCILVSKQWERGSLSDLRTRKHLTIGRYVNRTPWKGKEEEYFVLKKKESLSPMAKSLKILTPSIRYLCFTCDDKWNDPEFVDFIQSLAPKLLKLHICFINLPVGEGIIYKSLLDLRCREADDETLTSCPHLQKIKCMRVFEGRDIHLTMKQISVFLSSKDSPQTMTQMESIIRLQNWRLLMIRFQQMSCITNPDSVLRLFRAFEKLVTFVVAVTDKTPVRLRGADKAVAHLVPRNRRLEKIFIKIGITRDSLKSIALLEYVRSSQLRDCGHVTSRGVVALVRGSGSDRLLEYVLIAESDDLSVSDADRQVIASVLSERQRAFGYDGTRKQIVVILQNN